MVTFSLLLVLVQSMDPKQFTVNQKLNGEEDGDRGKLNFSAFKRLICHLILANSFYFDTRPFILAVTKIIIKKKFFNVFIVLDKLNKHIPLVKNITCHY